MDRVEPTTFPRHPWPAVAAVVALLFIATGLGAQEPLTLTAALERALEVHPDLQAAGADLQSAGLALRLAEIDRTAPKVSLSAAPTATLDAGSLAYAAGAAVSGSLTLPWGTTVSARYGAILGNTDPLFRDSHSISVSQDLLTARDLTPASVTETLRRREEGYARQQVDDISRQVRLTVTTQFLALAESQQQVVSSTQALAQSQGQLRILEELQVDSIGARLELVGQQIAVLQAENSLALQKAQLQLDTVTLSLLLQLDQPAVQTPRWDADALVAAAETVLAQPPGDADLEANLSVIQARDRVAAAEVALKQAQRDQLLDAVLAASYSKGLSGVGIGSVTLELSVAYNAYDGGRLATVISQRSQQVSATRRSLEQTLQSLSIEAQRMRNQLAANRGSLAVAELRRFQAELELQIFRSSWEGGLLDKAAWESAQLRSQDAQDAWVAAANDLLVAYLTYQESRGGPLDVTPFLVTP